MFSRVLGVCASVVMLSAPLHAQENYPNQTIRIIAGFAAGGGTDNVARVLGQAMSERLGQPVVVENQPGASGTIATGYVARSDPDGYTLLLLSSSSLTAAHLQDQVPFELDDIAMVSLLQRSPLHLLTNAQFEAQDLHSLVELVKANPGKYGYASAGAGGAGDIMARIASRVIGLDMISIPYAGDGQSAPDVASGVVPIWASGLSGSKGMWEAGRVTMLVSSGAERAPYAPDVPTFKELGYDVENYFFNALAAPAGTPPEIIEKLDAVVAEIYQNETLVQQIADVGGVVPVYMGSEEATQFIRQSIEEMMPVLVELKDQM